MPAFMILNPRDTYHMALSSAQEQLMKLVRLTIACHLGMPTHARLPSVMFAPPGKP